MRCHYKDCSNPIDLKLTNSLCRNQKPYHFRSVFCKCYIHIHLTRPTKGKFITIWAVCQNNSLGVSNIIDYMLMGRVKQYFKKISLSESEAENYFRMKIDIFKIFVPSYQTFLPFIQLICRFCQFCDSTWPAWDNLASKASFLASVFISVLHNYSDLSLYVVSLPRSAIFMLRQNVSKKFTFDNSSPAKPNRESIFSSIN